MERILTDFLREKRQESCPIYLGKTWSPSVDTILSECSTILNLLMDICKHFSYVFGCSRIPHKNCDEIQLHSESKHILVIRFGRTI